MAFGVPVYRWQPGVPYEIMVGAARRVAATMTLTVLKPLHAAALREVETIPDGTSLDRFPAQTVAELRVFGWIQPVAPGSDRYMLTDLGAEVLEGRPRDHDPYVAAQVREIPR